MMRNLKALLFAGMALAVFGAMAASSAHAAEERFHCEVAPCTYTAIPDEVKNTKTAHHVFIVDNTRTKESLSFTCGELSGEGTSATLTTNEIPLEKITYKECFAAGSVPIIVNMTGCTFQFKATKAFVVTGTDDAGVFIICKNVGEHIDLEYNGCVLKIPPQGPLGGITFHNHNAKKELITVETNTKGITVTSPLAGTKAQCLIDPVGPYEGTYTTGNTLVTAETSAGVMKNNWFE